MIVIGHRGACGYEIENTIKSFEKAIELGVGYVELDVQRTRDDQIVVLHDQTTPNGILIEEITLYDLRQELSQGGVIVPTLDEVLEFIDGRVGINIEIKSKMPVEHLIKKIRKHACALDRIIVSSFIHDCISQFNEMAPQIKTGILLKDREFDLRDMLRRFPLCSIIQNHTFIDNDYVNMVHAANAQIFVWTVNEPKDIMKMIALDVDGIISDFPDRVRLYLTK